MAIGVFFIILAILLVIAMPVGGVFGMMSLLPSLMHPDFSFAAADVARSMFADSKFQGSQGQQILKNDRRCKEDKLHSINDHLSVPVQR